MKLEEKTDTGGGPGADTNTILVSAVGFIKSGYEFMTSEVGATAPVQRPSRIELCKLVLEARGVLASVKELAEDDIVKRSLKNDTAEYEEELEKMCRDQDKNIGGLGSCFVFSRGGGGEGALI